VQLITVCGFTTDNTNAPLFRLPVDPDEAHGLTNPGRIMVGKIMTVPRSKLGRRIGRLNDVDMVRLSRAVAVFVGLAG
jgi:mRNA interferase MazF